MTIIGFSFLFVKLVLEYAHPIDVLMYRFAISFIVMTIFVLFGIVKLNYRGKPIHRLVWLATLYPVAFFIFQTYGLQFATSAEGGILFAFTPILTMVLAAIFLKETTTMLQKVSIMLSVIGILIIFMQKWTEIELTSLSGIALLLLSTLTFAGYSVLARSLLSVYRPAEVTYFMLGCGFVTFFFLSLIPHLMSGTIQQLVSPLVHWEFIVSILYLSVLASLVTAFTSNYALSKLEASKVSVFANLSTVWSIVAGAVLLGEKITVYHLIGTIMIIAGVIGANRNKLIKSKKGEQNHMPKDFNAIIHNRGAVKHFDSSHKLNELQIKELLELASRAPSAWNLQHWKFIVITDDAARKKLLPIAYGQEQIMNASVVIAVLGDLEAYRNADSVYDPVVKSGEMTTEAKSNLVEEIVTSYNTNGTMSRDEAIRNASLAAMQLLLAAKATGLDSCPMGGFDHIQFVKAFHVPQRYVPVMLIAIGKAASPARPSSRLPIEQAIVWNEFDREIANE